MQHFFFIKILFLTCVCVHFQVEDAPLTSDVKSTTYKCTGDRPQTIIKTKRSAISAISYRPVKMKRIAQVYTTTDGDQDGASVDLMQQLSDSDSANELAVKSEREMNALHGPSTQTDVSVSNSPSSNQVNELLHREITVNSPHFVHGTSLLPCVAEQPCVSTSDAEEGTVHEAGSDMMVGEGNSNERNGPGGQGESSGRGGDEDEAPGGTLSIKVEPMDGSAAETVWTEHKEAELKKEAGVVKEERSESDSKDDEEDNVNDREVLESKCEEENERPWLALKNRKGIRDLRRQAESMACNKCGTMFATVSSCWQHLTRYIHDECYKCSVCGKGFRWACQSVVRA